jgi:hypothetical protein
VSNKLTVFIVVIFFVFPGFAFGEETAGIEVNVNSSDVEGKFEFRLPHYETNIIAGAGILYSDDNHLISNLNIFLKDQVFVRPLSIGIGFKGGFGTAEEYNIDYDMATIGFLFTGEYDFRKHEDRLKIPISLNSTFSIAPKPLCFIDAKQYFDFSFTVYAHVLKNVSILAGYRHLDFRFEKITGTITKTDEALFLGCKLHF